MKIQTLAISGLCLFGLLMGGCGYLKSTQISKKVVESDQPELVLQINGFLKSKDGSLKAVTPEYLEVFLVDLLSQHGFTKRPELAKKLKVLLGNGVRAQKNLKFSELTPLLD